METPTRRYRLTASLEGKGVQIRSEREHERELVVMIGTWKKYSTVCRAQGPPRLLASGFEIWDYSAAERWTGFLFHVDVHFLLPAMVDCIIFTASDHNTTGPCRYRRDHFAKSVTERTERALRWQPVSVPLMVRIAESPAVPLTTDSEGMGTIQLADQHASLAKAGRATPVAVWTTDPSIDGRADVELSPEDVLQALDDP